MVLLARVLPYLRLYGTGVITGVGGVAQLAFAAFRQVERDLALCGVKPTIGYVSSSRLLQPVRSSTLLRGLVRLVRSTALFNDFEVGLLVGVLSEAHRWVLVCFLIVTGNP